MNHNFIIIIIFRVCHCITKHSANKSSTVRSITHSNWRERREQGRVAPQNNCRKSGAPSVCGRHQRSTSTHKNLKHRAYALCRAGFRNISGAPSVCREHHNNITQQRVRLSSLYSKFTLNMTQPI